MKQLQVTLLILTLPLLLTACSSLPPILGGAANQLKNIIDVTLPGTYVVTVTKNSATLAQMTWVCTKTENVLPDCVQQATVADAGAVTVK
jgi:hypothetical protein